MEHKNFLNITQKRFALKCFDAIAKSEFERKITIRYRFYDDINPCFFFIYRHDIVDLPELDSITFMLLYLEGVIPNAIPGEKLLIYR